MGLAQLGRFRRAYNPGDVICYQNDEANEFFILEKGIIGIYRDNQKLAEISENGAYIGELGVLLKQPRNATMKCETAITCYALPAHGLEKLLESNSDVAMKLIQLLARRLDETTRQVKSQDAA